MPKSLSVTTDVYDNILFAGRRLEERHAIFTGRHLTKRHLDELMAYCASMGASCHEWIVDTIWTLYDEDGPVGYDLLAEACDAAHRHGMTFHAVFKPFEGALDHPAHTLPSTFPRPDGAAFLDEPEGIVDPVRSFLAKHPEMRMARHPDDAADPGGRIAAVRLIKNDDVPLPFDPEALSIWTSVRNGAFRRYEGDVSAEEHTESRLQPGAGRAVQSCRILTLTGLDLPQDTRFLFIRHEQASGNGDFTNDVNHLVELLNDHGHPIPTTPSRMRVNTELLFNRSATVNRLGLTRYGRTPEVRACFEDRDWFLREAEGMFRFDFEAARGDVALNDGEEVAIMRGKPRHLGGILSPVYPEVRQHWLETIQFCLDRGVDGVGIRPGSHSWAVEPWAFGFNEPALKQAVQPDNVAEIARINGAGYRTFIREASELVRSHGKQFGYHVSVPFVRHLDRDALKTEVIRNLDWQWEDSVRAHADYVELRGLSQLRPENVRAVTDRVGLLARETGIPLVFPCRPPKCDLDLTLFLDHPDVTGYTLYESAHFTRVNERDAFEGDEQVAERVRKHLASQS